MLVNLRLHGKLGQEYGKGHIFHLTTPSDLVKAMNSNYPTFKKRILEYETLGFGYRLVPGDDLSGASDLDYEDLNQPIGSKTLHLIPVIKGSGGFFRVITGVALVGAGFLLGGFGAGLLPNLLLGIGASTVLGGINQILSPRPQFPTFEDQENNTIFGAGGGVSPFRYGIPIVSGTFRIKQPAILSSSSKALAPDEAQGQEESNQNALVKYYFPEFYGDKQIERPETSIPLAYPVWNIQGTLKNSTLYSVVAAISEGEIEGHNKTTLGQSIFLDDTPLLDSDGAENFPGTKYSLTRGTPHQVLGQAFPNALLSETSVGVQLEQDTPVVRSVTGGEYYSIWIKLQVQQLFDVKSKSGKISSEFLDVLFEVDTDDRGYVPMGKVQYNAKTQKPFEQTFEMALPVSVSKVWNIRVTKTKGAASEEDKAQVAWASYTTLAQVNNNFPRTSILSLEVDAEFLGRVPEVAVEVDGIKHSVPHNYDPVARTYSGNFTGKLKEEKFFTSNPVWFLYSVLTVGRYGFGLNPDQIDLFSFYDAAVYCDGMVSDGEGGMEPRYTMNVSITQRVEGQELVRAIASSMNAFPVYNNGKIGIAQDRPAIPVWAFTQANVVVNIDGEGNESPSFNYSQVDYSTRYTAADIAYIEPTDNWEQNSEVVKDATLTGFYGYKNREVAAFGCTSRGQARRAGRWEVYTSNYNDLIVSFSAARDMMPIEVGEVIEIFDRYEQPVKLAGRVRSVTNPTTLVLDQTVDLQGEGHVLTIYYEDGTTGKREVSAVDGSAVTLASAFTKAIKPGDMFALRRDDAKPTLWKVISISEESDEVFEVQASSYTDLKWAYVEDGTALPRKQPSLLGERYQAPDNLKLTTTTSLDESLTKFVVNGTFEWDKPASEVKEYDVRCRRLEAYEWIYKTVQGERLDMLLEFDTYEFNVRSVSLIGIKSPWAKLTKEVNLSADIPADVSGFAIDPRQTNLGALRWDPSEDDDVRLAGLIRIRFSKSGGGWSTAQLIDEFPGNSRTGIVPLLTGVYYAKWVDPFGNVSVNATSIRTSAAGFPRKNVVATLTENPDFAGLKTNCVVSNSNLTIETDSGSVKPLATYNFGSSLTVTTLQNVEIVADYSGYVTSNTGQMWDAASGLFDARLGVFDGDAEGDAAVEIQTRISRDGTTFGEWQPFTVGVFSLLKAEFRAVLRSDGTENIVITELSVSCEVAARAESGSVVTLATGDTNVVFSTPYVVAPPSGISYSIQSGTTEDEVAITNLTKNGFTINVYQSDNRLARTIRWSTESY